MTSTAAQGRRARLAAAWRSGPLSAPAFRLLTAGQFTSTIGDYCYAVALPWLILTNHGTAAQLGIVLACYGIARAALTVPRARPAMLIGAAFLVAAVAIALAPFLGGLPGVAGAMLVFGIAIGFDNVLSITLLQQWAPPAMLGRVMGLIMLAGAGTFPISAAIAGLLTRHLGPSPVFPIAGVLLAAAMLGGLTQKEFRDFGTADRAAAAPEPPDGERVSEDVG